jgi:hypothetical protein
MMYKPADILVGFGRYDVVALTVHHGGYFKFRIQLLEISQVYSARGQGLVG